MNKRQWTRLSLFALLFFVSSTLTVATLYPQVRSALWPAAADIAPETQTFTAVSDDVTSAADVIVGKLTVLDTASGRLPVGDVAYIDDGEDESKETQTVAIVIPQVHKYPGSDAHDDVNDPAMSVQGEIYDILTYLNEEHGVDMVVAEGELAGSVPQEEINRLQQRIAVRNGVQEQIIALNAALENETSDSPHARELLHALHQWQGELDREIILTGAAHVLKANNDTVVLYGAENRETREESANIVRSYVYQKDRMRQLQGIGSLGGVRSILLDRSITIPDELLSLPQIGNNNFSLLKALLQKRLEGKGPSLLGSDGSSLKQQLLRKLLGHEIDNTANAGDRVRRLIASMMPLVQQRDATVFSSVLRSVETLTEQWQALARKSTISAGTSRSLPSRGNNPYRTMTSVRELKNEMEKTERDIQHVVVDRRNAEAADSFVRALEENGESVGVVQFGAGHQEGLVQELQRRGVDVLVLIPSTVLERRKARGEQ